MKLDSIVRDGCKTMLVLLRNVEKVEGMISDVVNDGVFVAIAVRPTVLPDILEYTMVVVGTNGEIKTDVMDDSKMLELSGGIILVSDGRIVVNK